MKYVLELEAATPQECNAHNNRDMLNICMDIKVSAPGPATSCTFSQIAKTYKYSLDASVQKVTKFTVEEAYEYVGDLTEMIKHDADDESADAAIMIKCERGKQVVRGNIGQNESK